MVYHSYGLNLNSKYFCSCPAFVWVIQKMRLKIMKNLKEKKSIRFNLILNFELEVANQNFI